jgi:hypothetical protein
MSLHLITGEEFTAHQIWKSATSKKATKISPSLPNRHHRELGKHRVIIPPYKPYVLDTITNQLLNYIHLTIK